MEVSPIAVILIHMDSKGDRLLYRYPYKPANPIVATPPIPETRRRNLYATQNTDELQTQQPPNINNICATTKNVVMGNSTGIVGGLSTGPCGGGGQLQGCADEVLSALLAVKQQLCNQKFELKVNDVRFVSHPTLIQRKEHQQQPQEQSPQQRLVSNTTNTSSTNTSINSNSPNLSSSATATTPPLPLLSINTSILPNTSSNSSSGSGSSTTTSAATASAATASAATTTTTTTTTSKALPQQMLINIVFALHAQASYSIVKCYHELSKRIGIALKVEEQRIGYLSDETMHMARIHDEISSQQRSVDHAFDIISERFSLAQALKAMYHDLCTTGLLSTTLNQNLTLSFCLPQKAHQLHKKGSMVDPEVIELCLRSLKPYHGMLLLVHFTELLDCIPPTAARMLLQLIDNYTPLMSLQSMAQDADLNLEHVNKLVSHLVYWAKAAIIYPLCETNVYVIAPDAPLHAKSHLAVEFETRFAGMSLFEVIADFSLPTSIGHLTTPLQQPARQGTLAQMVLWMLQHHLLMQLHTYVQFMPSNTADDIDQINDPLNMDILSSTTVMQQQQQHHNTDTTGTSTESSDEIRIENVASDLNELNIGSPTSMLMSGTTDFSDEELNPTAVLSRSSMPLPVPQANRHSINEDQYSADGSATSDNIAVQPSSSHKSNLSITASISTENRDSIASIEDEEKIKDLLDVFDESDRAAIRRIPASINCDDLSLMVKLYRAGYFKSEHHLEEIMYFQSLRRSQLLQLLDKFRDVLIIYETEDRAIASMYNNSK